MLRRVLVLALAAASALALLVAPATAEARDVQRYLVGLRADVAAAPAAVAAAHGRSVDLELRHAFRGFATRMTAAEAAEVARDRRVAFVEADRTFTVTAELPTGVDRLDAERLAEAGIGSGQAIDVDVAVLDTGVDAAHRDLTVVSSTNCVSTLFASGCKSGGTDDNGHGTHVAGTIGARDNGLDVVGVAPGARIWSVKVLSGPLGSGSTTDIVRGIEWVTARADQIEVINMSLGGSGTSAAMNTAIANATKAGIVVVVAAGNDGANASGSTPANAPNAITVSAISDTDGQPGGRGSSCSGPDDSLADYSNYGSVVEIAAPGSCITSTRDGGGTTSLSGTSMASPHVAGAAALRIASAGVARTASRWTTVLGTLTGEWATPASSPCGFTGARSAEPLLLLVPCGGSTPPPPPPPDPEPQPEPVPADAAVVSGVTYATGSLLFGGRYLDATVALDDEDGANLSGAAVTIELRRAGAVYATSSGTTGSNGPVTFQHDGVPTGCYTTLVTAVTAAGRTWDGTTPANERCI